MPKINLEQQPAAPESAPAQSSSQTEAALDRIADAAEEAQRRDTFDRLVPLFVFLLMWAGLWWMFHTR